MAIMLKQTYQALKEAGASEESATAAAEELAGYEDRFARIERDLLLLKWMVGVNTAGIALIIGLLLTRALPP